MSKYALFAVAAVAALTFGVTTAFASHNQTTPTGCIATNGSDFFSGTQFADSCQTLAGNDELAGREGNDNLAGNQNDDIVRGGKGDDTLGANFGDESGNDDIRAGDDNDNADGGAGNDEVAGGSGTDTLDDPATGDNDTLRGGSGNDFVHTGDANVNFDQDVADGGEGFDNCFVNANDTAINCEQVNLV